MGRFYRTAKPQFLDDTIYTPPWQLMQQAIATADLRTDQIMKSSDYLAGQVDKIDHLNFEAENKRVSEIQQEYNDSINQLTESIYKDPLQFKKHLPAMRKLQRDFLTRKQSGDIFHIESRHRDYNKWLKDNEEMAKENPTQFNELNQFWLKKLETEATADSKAKFKGEQIIGRPGIAEKWRETFENIKSNKETRFSDGRRQYLINDEWVSESEVADIAVKLLMSDPDFQGFARQEGVLLNKPGFVTEDKKGLISPFMLVGPDNQPITPEEFNKLSKKDKKKVQRVLNPGSAYYNELSAVAQVYGFRQMDMEADDFAKERLKGGIKSQLQKERHQQRLIEKEADFNHKYNLAKAKGDIELMDDVVVASAPFAAITREELPLLGEKWIQLTNKLSSKKQLTGEEQIEYNKINEYYRGVIDSHGDDILKAAGYTDAHLKNMDPRYRENRLKRLISQMSRLNDPEFGIKRGPGGPGMIGAGGFGGGPTSTIDNSERLRIQAIKDKVNEVVGDFDENLVNSSVITRGMMPVDKSTELGSIGLSLVNSIHRSGIAGTLIPTGTLSYDINDNKRGATKVAVDTEGLSQGLTNNPIQSILDATGLSTPEELIEEGYGNFRWRIERGDYIVDFIPNNAKLDEAGIDVNDSNWNQEGFSARYTLDTDLISKLPGDNATINQAMRHADVTYSEAANKIDRSISNIKTVGNAIPFVMSGTGNLYKLKFDKGTSRYYILEKPLDSNLTWEEIEESSQELASTANPESLKLYLRKKSIEALRK